MTDLREPVSNYPPVSEGGPEIPPQPENSEQNFNDQVWVKITPEGERIRDRYFKELTLETPPLEKDAEGWTKMQLYEVAELFGSEMYNGNSRLPIETIFRTKAPGEEASGAIRNFNDKVWIKVTPEGEQVRREHFTGLRMDTPTIQRDAEGWTEMHLHEVANLFGAKMYNGNSYLPIETIFRTEAPKK